MNLKIEEKKKNLKNNTEEGTKWIKRLSNSSTSSSNNCDSNSPNEDINMLFFIPEQDCTKYNKKEHNIKQSKEKEN